MQQAQTLLLVKKPEHELTGQHLPCSANELAGRSKGVFLPLEQHAKLGRNDRRTRVIETVTNTRFGIDDQLAPLIAIFYLEWYLHKVGYGLIHTLIVNEW